MNPDEGAQDWADAQALYELLETDIVPRWYDRDPRGLPRRWTQVMRRSMATTIWRFSTARMLEQYVEQSYLPAALGEPDADQAGAADVVGSASSSPA